jgi:hypothetical protein
MPASDHIRNLRGGIRDVPSGAEDAKRDDHASLSPFFTGRG